MEADHRPLPPPHIEQQQHHHQQQQQFLHHPTTHLTLLHHPSNPHPHSQPPPPFLAHPLIFHAPLHPHLLHFHHLQQQQQQFCHHQERISERGHDQIHHPVGLRPQLRHTVHQPQPHLPQEGHSLLSHHSQPHFQLRQFDQQLPLVEQQSEPTSEEFLQHPQDHAVRHREEIVEDPKESKDNSPKEINTENESYSSSSSSSNREKNRDGFQIQCRDSPVDFSQKRPLAPIATSLGDPSFGEVLASLQSAVRNQALQNQHISTYVPSMDHSLDAPADVTYSPEEQGVQAEAQMEHSSPTVHSLDQPKGKKKRKKLKQVQFQLDLPVHQKLMRIVCEKHDGRLEKFVSATLNASEIADKLGKKMVIRKPILSKWKRTRFEQMKANETQELAMVFRSLVESTPGLEVAPELFSIPWQELTMTQIEKMLEETKKMLFLNEKVHDCSECGKRFATPSSLKDHQNEHSGAKPYNCKFEDCAMQFKSKQLLCRHLKKHECAHKCTFEGCGKRFAFRERLIVHQKIHSNERPLVCPWEGCGKSFKWTNSLHGHLRTHTGEKPFQCTFQGCGRLFGYKVDLTRHLRTHYGEPARGSH